MADYIAPKNLAARIRAFAKETRLGSAPQQKVLQKESGDPKLPAPAKRFVTTRHAAVRGAHIKAGFLCSGCGAPIYLQDQEEMDAADEKKACGKKLVCDACDIAKKPDLS